jgi:nucleoside-diphosphate-sugar epimerase
MPLRGAHQLEMILGRTTTVHILIVGCGYLGQRVADRAISDGHRVTALTRSAEKARSLNEAGIESVIGDVLESTTVAALPAADVLVVALTHDPASGVSKRGLLVDGVVNLVRELGPRVEHVIYISSTSVYGQTDGSWVVEGLPAEPITEGGELTLAAELALKGECRYGARLTILRLAGIYGPGRLIARIDQLRSGAPVPGSPDAWLNLIHVDDAAAAVCTAFACRHTWDILMICDDRPLTRREFYSAVAQEVGAPLPTFDPDAATGRRTSGLNKRCSNSRMHGDLGIKLLFPDAIAALPLVIAASR